MEEQAPEDVESSARVRDQLALGALACLLLSVAMGMLPDSVVSSSMYRTGAWLVFGLLALLCFYLAYPHTWTYSLWLAGVYGGSAFGLVLLAGMGGSLFPIYWTAAIIGLLFECVALAIVYTILMRIRIARAVVGGRGTLGLWLLGVVGFYFLSNISAAGWVVWARTGSSAALAVYAAFEALMAFTAVYVCWSPEQAIWGTQAAEAAAPAPAQEGEPSALLKMLSGRKESLPKACPACGATLKPVVLRCPSCGEKMSAAWCAASESYVVACPTCGSPALSADGRCRKCGASLSAMVCPHCKKAAPFKDWGKWPGAA